MAGFPPPFPPPGTPYGFDPRMQRRLLRDQQRFQQRAQRDAERAQRDRIRFQMRGLRRSSIVGPIFLIAAGIVFLLFETGRISHQNFWAVYSRWWPMILVGAGAILFLEWAFDQYHQRDPAVPQFRRSLGGGITFLLILAASIGFTSQYAGYNVDSNKWLYGWHFDQDNLDEFFGDKHESDQPLDFHLPTGNTISIDNPHGDVTVTGTSDDSHIHVTVHKQVYSRSDSDAYTKAQQLTPRTSNSSGNLSLTVPSIDGAHADLTVTLPAGDPVRITANHGDISVSSLKAAVSVTANHGDIALDGISGQVDARINHSGSSLTARSLGAGLSVDGRADDVTLTDIAGAVSIRGEYFGSTHLERIAGPTRFHTSRTDFELGRLDGEVQIEPGSELSADRVVGPVVVKTRDRNITLDSVAGDISVNNRNGTVDVTAAPALGTIAIDNRNGAVRMTVPDRGSFSVRGETTNGSIDNDFGLPNSENNHRETLTGIVGTGGPMVRLSTTNADLSIRKGSVVPIAPEPPRAASSPDASKSPQPPSSARAASRRL